MKLSELIKLADAATPGPWREGTPPPNGTTTVGTTKGLMTAHCFNGQDSAFIAAANPTTVKRMAELLVMCREMMTKHDYDGVFMEALAALDAFEKEDV